MRISIQDRAQKALNSVQRQIATMDRAAEFPLQSRAVRPARHSYKRNSQGKSFGCLLAFCLLAVFTLALPVCYLLARHLNEPQACKAEERAERMPEFKKQSGTPSDPELKPRAHLTELDPHRVKCVPGEFPTLQWKYDQKSQSMSKATMKYENGSLVIPQPGDYFVYAQVTFRNHSTKKEKCGTEIKAVTLVTQTISKLTSGYPVPIELLRSSSSIGEMQNWNHAIYLGAIASLQANDKLFVNVSNSGLVYNRGTANFFGAFLI